MLAIQYLAGASIVALLLAAILLARSVARISSDVDTTGGVQRPPSEPDLGV